MISLTAFAKATAPSGPISFESIVYALIECELKLNVVNNLHSLIASANTTAPSGPILFESIDQLFFYVHSD